MVKYVEAHIQLKQVFNTCIVPGQCISLTSTFSLWLGRNKGNRCSQHQAPRPVTVGGRRSGQKRRPPATCQSARQVWPMTSRQGAGSLSFNQKIFLDSNFVISLKTCFKRVCGKGGGEGGDEGTRMKARGQQILPPTLLGSSK